MTRPACEVALPAAWQQAIAGSEVATVRDNGDTRDLLLIGPDRSITASYTVPNRKGNYVEFMTIGEVTMDYPPLSC